MKLIKKVWLFGSEYESVENDIFLEKFKKIPLFTYRVEFENIYPTTLNSDVGWGCMIRSGQMMLGYTLSKNIIAENHDDCMKKYKEILNKFNDVACNPFSIHNISTVGSFMGIEIGSWFGPTITSLSLQLINNEEDDSDLNISVCQDGIIEKNMLEENIKIYKKNLILLPIMLGLNNISQKYEKFILDLFEFELFVGIIGGKKNTSLYFVGKQDNKLLYLDPHKVNHFKENIDMNEYVCSTFEFLNIKDLDPSMSLGFYLCSENDYQRFTEYVNTKFNSDDFPICIGDKKNIENIEFHKKENDWEFISQ